ncbi:unnamed protein product [Lepeophtheirus salmonis]|uniref:(salmon louse) hypothetical protein n=1 Tax=Lepeophtheirus salmonis TaxID=72036 RepID=A0A7R8H162_LEPSM|nr:unnamed protein product [Lepeophtheirus salmonis]CAF2803294.1 unnamed protein product [Lepeophtheirus salmonis]
MFHLHLLLLFLVPSSTHSYFLNFDRFESWLEAYVQQEGISSVLVITEDTSDLDPEEHTVMHDIYFRLNSYGITFSALHVSSYNDSWNTDRDKQQLRNDGSYGTEVGGGEFDGLLGMVQKSEVDVSPQAFTMTEKRQKKHITFSNFLIKTSWKLYLNDPGAIPLNWYSYLKVFHNRFWLGIIITILIFDPLSSHFFAVFFAVLGSTFGSEIPTRTYFRILILTISLFGAILSWIFNATLVAILTSVVTKESVGSLKDLLERPEYQLILLNGTVVVDDFRYAFEIKDNPSAKLYQRVYTKLIEGQEEKVFLSEDKVIDGLRGTNRVVLYAEEFTTVLLLKDYPCSITEGKLKYGFSNLAWAFAPDFEYREMFDYEIRRLKEQGLYHSGHWDFSVGVCGTHGDGAQLGAKRGIKE